ncbi:MAG: V-type ATPase subunit [Candidatus Omnitrophica bacterium]|nr:V-type ATPase subunit [Candidatus Omnitrophota bacterium]MCM8799117.1 V-type ATPase subunit [Candidatus Omnitrophota bacterium]
MKRRLKPTDYTFAVGKIRALETTLLKREDFQQLLNLDFYKIKEFLAKNRYYTDKVLKLENPQDIEDFLESKRIDLENLTKALFIEKEIFFLIKEILDYPLQAVKKVTFLKSKFLEDFFKCYLDLFNIRMFFSLKKEKEFLDGGFIPKKIFLESEGRTETEFIKIFKTTPYNRIIEEGFSYYKKENTFLYLETLIRSYLIKFIKIQKYNPFGIEPIFSYYLARINEFDLLRIILLGKLFYLDKEILTKALIETYV